jgi:chromosome segregation ATPase
MAIIELKNISGLLEATMSEYIDSAVVKEKTTRKELVKLLQATDESLDTVLNNMEGKVARINALQHSLDALKLENSKLSQELQDTTEGLAEVEAIMKSLEHDLGEAVLEKNNAEEREAEVKLERDSYKSQLEGASNELKILKASYNLALDQLDQVRGENIDLRGSLEVYKSRGFFARIFNW